MTGIVILRQEADPLALRASIGGREGMGFYLNYRGDPAEVLKMLQAVVAVAEKELPKQTRPQG